MFGISRIGRDRISVGRYWLTFLDFGRGRRLFFNRAIANLFLEILWRRKVLCGERRMLVIRRDRFRDRIWTDDRRGSATRATCGEDFESGKRPGTSETRSTSSSPGRSSSVLGALGSRNGITGGPGRPIGCPTNWIDHGAFFGGGLVSYRPRRAWSKSMSPNGQQTAQRGSFVVRKTNRHPIRTK